MLQGATQVEKGGSKVRWQKTGSSEQRWSHHEAGQCYATNFSSVANNAAKQCKFACSGRVIILLEPWGSSAA